MAKDIFHNIVMESLIADGWDITHDGYKLLTELLKDALSIDIGAEKLITATRKTEKIAVESDRRCGKEFFGRFPYL
jgi:XisH protein